MKRNIGSSRRGPTFGIRTSDDKPDIAYHKPEIPFDSDYYCDYHQ
jgi:hypothetical protein